MCVCVCVCVRVCVRVGFLCVCGLVVSVLVCLSVCLREREMVVCVSVRLSTSLSSLSLGSICCCFSLHDSLIFKLTSNYGHIKDQYPWL